MAAALDQVPAAIAYYLSHKEDVQAYTAHFQAPDIASADRMAPLLRQKLDNRFRVQVKDGRIRITPPTS